MLSLISTGIPCRGPRGPLALRSLSSASAIASASGFVSITLRISGPCASIASMRARYFSAIDRAVCFPDFMPSCSSAIVPSSNSKAFASSRPPRAKGFRPKPESAPAPLPPLANAPSRALSRTSTREALSAGANAAAPTIAPAFKNFRRADPRASFLISSFFFMAYPPLFEFALPHGTPLRRAGSTVYSNTGAAVAQHAQMEQLNVEPSDLARLGSLHRHGQLLVRRLALPIIDRQRVGRRFLRRHLQAPIRRGPHIPLRRIQLHRLRIRNAVAHVHRFPTMDQPRRSIKRQNLEVASAQFLHRCRIRFALLRRLRRLLLVRQIRVLRLTRPHRITDKRQYDQQHAPKSHPQIPQRVRFFRFRRFSHHHLDLQNISYGLISTFVPTGTSG